MSGTKKKFRHDTYKKVDVYAHSCGDIARRIIKKSSHEQLRFSVWEEGEKRVHYKYMQETLQQIETREFDHIIVRRLEQMCSDLSIPGFKTNLCKLELLDLLDSDVDKARKYLEDRKLSKHLGNFSHLWDEEGNVYLKLRPGPQDFIKIDVRKKGIIDFLLESSQGQSAIIAKKDDEIKKLQQQVLDLSTQNKQLQETLDQNSWESEDSSSESSYEVDSSETRTDQEQEHDYHLAVKKSKTGESVLEVGLLGNYNKFEVKIDDKSLPFHLLEILEEKISSLTTQDKSLKQENIKLKDEIGKIYSSFEESQISNEELQKELIEMKSKVTSVQDMLSSVFLSKPETKISDLEIY